MRSLERHLVREDERILPLLTPPFDKTPKDPGYIKGYLPGVRENGAQYTHAALWAVLATAMQGNGDRAFELFQMINPLTRTRTPEEVAVYQLEPYVVAADVYTAAGHVGRGGWSWYTGSASWMYRVGLETILGFAKRGETIGVDPRVPERLGGIRDHVPASHERLRDRRRAAAPRAEGESGGVARWADARHGDRPPDGRRADASSGGAAEGLTGSRRAPSTIAFDPL